MPGLSCDQRKVSLFVLVQLLIFHFPIVYSVYIKYLDQRLSFSQCDASTCKTRFLGTIQQPSLFRLAVPITLPQGLHLLLELGHLLDYTRTVSSRILQSFICYILPMMDVFCNLLGERVGKDLT